jgi:MFS family permease
MGGLVNQRAFNDTFNSPSPTMIGLIVSIMEIGAFLGSICTAVVGEQLGRKKSIAIGVITLITGSLLQATAYHRAHLIVGRVVAGIGLGMVNSTVPVMQAEFAPKASRGLCTSPCLPKKSNPDYLLTMISCLYANINPQFWDPLRVLDRLRLLRR